jgi:hypothetical protein
MTAIKPIIKKNFIYSKRNFCRTLFQLFYPCIFLWIIGLMLNKIENIPIKEQTYYEYSKVLDTLENSNFREISSVTSQSSYAVIGKDDLYREKLIEILSPQKLSKIKFNLIKLSIRRMLIRMQDFIFQIPR